MIRYRHRNDWQYTEERREEEHSALCGNPTDTKLMVSLRKNTELSCGQLLFCCPYCFPLPVPTYVKPKGSHNRQNYFISDRV